MPDRTPTVVPVNPSLQLLGGKNSLADDLSGGGVNTQFPATQLKYYQSWDSGQKTQARLYISLPESSKKAIRAQVTSGKEGARLGKLFDTLCGDNGYIDFILSSVSESNEERVQPVELLGDDYVAYFFGQRIPTFSYSGTLFTTLQDDWWDAFSLMYREIMRGTKLAQHQGLVHLSYDSRVVSGAMLNMSASLSAETQMAASFSFSLMVKQVSYVRPKTLTRQVFEPTQLADPFGGADFNRDVFKQRLALDIVGANIVTGTIQEVRPTADPAATAPTQDTTIAKEAAAALEIQKKIAPNDLAAIKQLAQDFVQQEGIRYKAAGYGVYSQAVPGTVPGTYNWVLKKIDYEALPDGKPDYTKPLSTDGRYHGVVADQAAMERLLIEFYTTSNAAQTSGTAKKVPSLEDAYKLNNAEIAKAAEQAQITNTTSLALNGPFP